MRAVGPARPLRSLALTLVGAVALVPLAAATGANAVPVEAVHTSARTAATPAAVDPTKKWQRLSAVGIESIGQPSVLRSGTTLFVAWREKTSGLQNAVRAERISSSGALLGVTSPVPSWASISDSPVLTASAAGPRVVFGGLRTADTGEFFSGQAAASTWNGSTWALDAASFSHSRSAYGATGFAATQYAGSTVNAFGASNSIVVHVGSDAGSPAAAADTVITSPVSTSTYYPSLVTDESTSTSTVWAAWSEIDHSVAADNGVRYAQVLPVTSAAAGIPGSRIGSDSLSPDQGVALAAVTSGPWAAYIHGYPHGTSVQLYNLRTHVTRTVPGSALADKVGLSAGPGGRLWVFWSYNKSGGLKATRTNAAVTAFEPVQTLTTPGTVYATRGEGRRGPLDIVITSEPVTTAGSLGLYYRRAVPHVSLTVSVRKGKATVHVKDAKTAVKGATVTWKGHTAKTNASGIAKITVGTKKGKRVISVTKSGYAKAKITAKVK